LSDLVINNYGDIVMKKLYKKTLVAALISLSVLFVFAATEKWRYTAPMIFVQVVADGNGGCSAAGLDTNGLANIFWFDNKGDIKYSSAPNPGFISGIIQSCSKKQLVYMSMIPMPLLVQVNQKRDEKPVVSLGGFLYGRPLPAMIANTSVFTDNKGFFVINVNTNAKTTAVVRYTYK